MTIDDMIAVLQAAKEGKEIQCRCRNSPEQWQLKAQSPWWNFERYDYRIKPEPREWWVNVYPMESHEEPGYERNPCSMWTTKEAAKRYAGTSARTIKVREVLE